MNDLSKAERISLLAAYAGALPPRWNALQNYIAMYFTIILACLGFVLTKIIDLFLQSREIILVVPLIIISLIAYFATKSISRQEKHIRELIVVVAKLEYSLGLYEKDETNGIGAPWHADPTFLPAPWINSRLSSGDRSVNFINEGLGGTSKLAAAIFLIILISCLLMAFVCVLSYAQILRF